MSIKLSLNMSDNTNQILEDLCKETELTKSEFIRRGVALMAYYIKYQKQGGHLAILDANDKKITDVVGLL